MKKNIYVLNENNEIDSYILDIDEDRINEIIRQIELETNKGKLIHTEGTHIPYKNYKGKKIEIFYKKRLDDKTIIFDYDFDDAIPYYKYSFYAYEENEIAKLAKDILNEENSLDLSCDIAKLFNEYYKLSNGDNHNGNELYLLEIINNIKFRKEIKNNDKKKENKILKTINYLIQGDYNLIDKKDKDLTNLVKDYGITDYNNINYPIENVNDSIPQKKLMF